jgi:aminopeptidase-like protein
MIGDWKRGLDLRAAGQEMYQLIVEMYPICRSITGEGLRRTLRILGRVVPIEMYEVPTGTKVFDWTIPKEWNVRDAYIKNSRGEKILDFQRSNLHLVNYSMPVRKKMPLEELKKHLHTLPEHPRWIPYRTSYYKESWGFCLSHDQFVALEDDLYEVHIDASLEPGSLTYGECYLPGESEDEVIFSCHTCHPSLCNDNLSGIALATFLARHLDTFRLRYSYRFLFIPGTIGAIAWLSRNEALIPRIKHGLVVACVGDPGKPTYKKCRRGDAEIDHAVMNVLRHSKKEHEIVDFSPYGYDERQYCSPGFNLPVGSLTRTPHGRYPQYHTSADGLDLVRPENLADSFSLYLSVIHVLENNRKFRNLNPKCEPQMGRRGLYSMIGGRAEGGILELAMLWVLNMSDGNHTLLDISDRSGLSVDSLIEASDGLCEKGLLKECSE